MYFRARRFQEILGIGIAAPVSENGKKRFQCQFLERVFGTGDLVLVYQITNTSFVRNY